MSVYANEFDAKPAAWLRELAARDHVRVDVVDERSIVDVSGADLAGFRQCHFFAGIGGWPYALALAGWPEDEEVWTGSCPCQPFSAAGKRGGAGDERHLWPAFYRLIAERRPAIVFGEQVASRDGRAWLAAVRADMEALGYAVGAADLCAAGAGAPHIRQRLYWGAVRLADAEYHGHAPERKLGKAEDTRRVLESERRCTARGLADADGKRRNRFGKTSVQPQEPAQGYDNARRLADAQKHGIRAFHGQPVQIDEQQESPGGRGFLGEWPCPPDGFWRAADWLMCRDEKWRPVEPGSFPLADGVSARVGRLRGYGNAIVPQVAAAFVMAFREALKENRPILAGPGGGGS